MSACFALAFLGFLCGAEGWVGVVDCCLDGLGGCEAPSDGTVEGALSLIMKEAVPVYKR